MRQDIHPVMNEALKAMAPPSEVESLRAQLGAIVHAYDMALSDPRAIIPTPLHAAIEAARRK